MVSYSRETYGIVHHPPSFLPYFVQQEASLPAFAHRHLWLTPVSGETVPPSDGNVLPPALTAVRL